MACGSAANSVSGAQGRDLTAKTFRYILSPRNISGGFFLCEPKCGDWSEYSFYIFQEASAPCLPVGTHADYKAKPSQQGVPQLKSQKLITSYQITQRIFDLLKAPEHSATCQAPLSLSWKFHNHYDRWYNNMSFPVFFSHKRPLAHKILMAVTDSYGVTVYYTLSSHQCTLHF